MKLENLLAGLIVLAAFGWVARSLWRSAKEKADKCARGCSGCSASGSCGVPQALEPRETEAGEPPDKP